MAIDSAGVYNHRLVALDSAWVYNQWLVALDSALVYNQRLVALDSAGVYNQRPVAIDSVSRCGLVVRRLAGKQKDLGSIRFGPPFSSLQKLWFMDTVL